MRMQNHKLAAHELSEMRSLLIVAGGLSPSNKVARPKMGRKEFTQALTKVYADSTDQHHGKGSGDKAGKLGVRHAATPHKERVATKPAAAQNQRPSIARGIITLPRGKEFLLIMECSADDIPEGVQIIPAPSPAKKSGTPAAPSGTRFNATKFDLASLLGRVSVKGMNVTKANANGYHLLYIKCEEVGNHKGELGFDTWKNTPYMQLAEKLLKRTWSSAVFKDDANGEKGQSSLALKKSMAALVATTKVSFAVEPVAK